MGLVDNKAAGVVRRISNGPRRRKPFGTPKTLTRVMPLEDSEEAHEN